MNEILTCRRCAGEFNRPTPTGRLPCRCLPYEAEYQRERSRTNNRVHAEARRASRRKWRDANAEKNHETGARWLKANVDRRRVYRRAAKKRNPIANRAYVHTYKARKHAQTVVAFTATQLRQRLEFYANRCWMCGGPGETLDHVKPLSKGGAHMLANLRPACAKCNSAKGQRWPFELVAA